MRLVVVICLSFISITKSELCNGKVCLRKCCENGFYVTGRKICTRAISDETVERNISRTEVYEAGPDGEMTTIGSLSDFFGYKPGFFSDEKVKNASILYELYYSSFHILRNGSVTMAAKHSNKSEILHAEDYCIDYFTGRARSKVMLFFKNPERKKNPSFYKYGFLVSSVFLLLLLAVYCLLPELVNLGGLILMAYSSSLMLAFIFLFSMMITNDHSITTCKSLTDLIYFFLMASFCWMNVMSYDIWWTFRGYAKARPIHRRGAWFKFCMYSLFAWGVPLAMTIALATLNEIEPHRLPGIIKPEIPDKGCFLEGPAKLVYMYIPMLIMILLNWLFFGMTVFNIWRLSRGTNILTAGDSSATGSASARRTQKHRFIVYLKLSVVMGLNWLLEVVSSFYPDSSAWYIFDTYNIFIGMIIFVIFVCKKKVLKKLKKRCCCSASVAYHRPKTLTPVTEITYNTVVRKGTGLAALKIQSFHPVVPPAPAPKAGPGVLEAQWSLTRSPYP